MKSLFERMRLVPRLALAFGLVLSVTLLASGVCMWRLTNLRDIADNLGGASAERALLAQELHAIVVISAERAETLMQTNDPGFASSINADRKVTSERSEVVRKRLESLAVDPHSRELFAAIDAAGSRFREARNSLIKRKSAGQTLASEDIHKVLRPAADDYAHAVEALSQYQAQRVATDRAAAGDSARQGIAMLAAGIAVGGALSLWCAWSLSRSIVQPLSQASRRAALIASGDLSSAVVADLGRDELQTLVADLSKMQTHLAAMVSDVKMAAESISTASSEIAMGNQDLSVRTEQTASSLEETASSMEELTATVRQSADASVQAAALAESASEVAVRGGVVMERVVVTMEDIAGASSRIAEIIGVIDGIAFQTNILALNAAVEAARAGEQGRGFAVVASEVRSLAQRSAVAAREIKTLIDESTQKVASGSLLVQEAGSTMGEIVSSVQRVSAIVGEIRSAATEQSDGISQVNVAIAHLDQMTQQNAALVEESTAATLSLKQEAQRLSTVTGAFRLS